MYQKQKYKKTTIGVTVKVGKPVQAFGIGRGKGDTSITLKGPRRAGRRGMSTAELIYSCQPTSRAAQLEDQGLRERKANPGSRCFPPCQVPNQPLWSVMCSSKEREGRAGKNVENSQVVSPLQGLGQMGMATGS